MNNHSFQVGQKVKVIEPAPLLPLGEYTVVRATPYFIYVDNSERTWFPRRFEAVIDAPVAATSTPQVAPKRRQVLIRGAKGRFVSPTISKLRNGSIYQTSQGVGRLLGVVGKKNRLAVVVTKDGTKTVQPAELRKVGKEVVREFLAQS